MTRKDLSVECLKYQLFFGMEAAKNHRFPNLVGAWVDAAQLEIWRKELEIKDIEDQNAHNEASHPEHSQSEGESHPPETEA